MGLSKGERYDGMMTCADQLYRLRGFRSLDLRPINRLLEAIWPTILSNQGNSGFWFGGGDLSANHMNETSLVKAAFKIALSRTKLENDGLDGCDGGYSGRLSKEQRELFQYLDQYSPTAKSLLVHEAPYGSNQHKPEYSDLFQVYFLTESFMYHVNRYDDEFARNAKKAKNLIAKIQGFCFQQFSEDPVYLAAWMTENIFQRLLEYNEKDTVTCWFRKNYLHHDIRIRRIQHIEILKLFRQFRQSEPRLLSSETRIKTVLKFCSFHYRHHHEELFKVIEQHNLKDKTKKDQICLLCIRKICADKTSQYDLEEKKLARQYSEPYDHLLEETVK